jgi:hypothetical protein
MWGRGPALCKQNFKNKFHQGLNVTLKEIGRYRNLLILSSNNNITLNNIITPSFKAILDADYI